MRAKSHPEREAKVANVVGCISVGFASVIFGGLSSKACQAFTYSR